MNQLFIVCSLALLLASAVAAIDPYSKAAYVPITERANMDHRADYCVVGAGFSGVKSIETIAVEGGQSNWLLIETQDRIGGRVETVTVGTGTSAYNVEEHAQWIQGDLSNPILKLATEMQPPLQGGHSHWEEYDYYNKDGVKANTGPGTLQTALSKLWTAYDCVYHELMPQFASGALADMSLRDCYSTCGFHPTTAEEYALESALIAVEWGELSDITSCANSGWWVAYSFYGADGRNTPNFVTDQRGLSSVAKYILTRKGISITDSRIHYNTRVTNIDTTDNVITATRAGRTVKYQCKTVINTIAIGAIQRSLREGSNLVTPVPSLSVQASYHKYHMGFYRKTFLQFKTKFWGEKAHFTITPRDPGFAVNSWTSLDYPSYYPGSRILLVSHNGPESNMFATIPDEEYVRRICAELEVVFGSAASFANLTTNGYFVGYDPYDVDLYGSYSNRPASLSTPEFVAMFAPVRGHYFPSGEAACDLLNGYVVGAYHIGHTSALRALINLGVLPETINPQDNECFRPPAGWRP